MRAKVIHKLGKLKKGKIKRKNKFCLKPLTKTQTFY